VGYTAAQAARISGCTISQVRYWARTGLVAPASPREYEFRDLVALRIVRSLLDAGLPTVRARAAIDSVRAGNQPDLTGVRLVTDGHQVWICHDDGQILDALRAGQLALFVAVDQVAADVDAEVASFCAERDAFVDQLRADAR
jgi:DNA-binding transcriptional MerR regulator